MSLYPFAVEHFDLSAYDLIFSSSSGYAKGVHRRSNAIHVCYCHTPMRWVWRYEASNRRPEVDTTSAFRPAFRFEMGLT